MQVASVARRGNGTYPPQKQQVIGPIPSNSRRNIVLECYFYTSCIYLYVQNDGHISQLVQTTRSGNLRSSRSRAACFVGKRSRDHSPTIGERLAALFLRKPLVPPVSPRSSKGQHPGSPVGRDLVHPPLGGPYRPPAWLIGHLAHPEGS